MFFLLLRVALGGPNLNCQKIVDSFHFQLQNLILSFFFFRLKMAIIRLISMNDKKFDIGDEHEYQQLQSGSSSEQNSQVSNF